MTNEKRNVIWNMLGASANAFNSLFFAIIVTRINGIDEAGIFTYCFATACVFYCIANYSGRTFQVTDISKKYSDTDYIFNRTFTAIMMIMVTIAFSLIKGYDIYKSAILVILCSFKAIEAFAESFYAVIQKNGELHKVGKSLLVKSLVSLASLIIIDLITHNLILASASILVVNIFFIIIYDYRNLKKAKVSKTKFSNEKNNSLLKVGFFTFILSLLSIYLVNAPRYAIDDLLPNSLQTIFGIVVMPASFMWLMAQYVIQPFLTKIADCIENKKYEELKKIVTIIISIIIGLGLMVLGVAWILEVPVLEVLYGVELDTYFTSMMIIIVGSIFFSLGTVLSAVLIAMRRTLGQAIVYGIVAVGISVLSYLLVKKMEVFGASITYFVSMFIVAVIFLIYTIFSLKKYKKEWLKEV